MTSQSSRPDPRFGSFVFLAWWTLAAPGSAAALPAFPGAEGYGSQTPGGRGGAVFEVTSLADSGPGTLRSAFESAAGPRTIVFRVGGTITLTSPIVLSGEDDSFVTVAGQTAPGDGIQVARYGLHVRDGAHDLVFRFLRLRPGNGSGDFQQDIDGLELWGNDDTQVHDVIVDHCSLQWAMDENFSSWADVVDVTVQRSLIAEAQVDGQDHGFAKGVLVGAENTDPKPDRFSFHHNVFAHNPDRNPRVAYATTDFRNNVVYDWNNNNSTMFGVYAGFPPGPHATEVNIVGNVWRRGPSSSTSFLDAVWLQPDARIYASANRGERCPSGCVDEWDLGFREEFGIYGPASAATYRVMTPFATPFVTTVATDILEDTLLPNVGASLPSRDEADTRILADVVAGTGAVGQNSDYPALVGEAAPADGDHDGMPDDWELAHALDPEDADDRNGDPDSDGYTNLEDYLAFRGPVEFRCGDGEVIAGEDCDDGNAVNGDGCDNNCTPTSCGNGIVTSGEDCDDEGGCCDDACHFEAADTACDDDGLCTPTDRCDGAGACVGAEAPWEGCREAAKGSILLDGDRGRLVWKWQSGEAVGAMELGDPVDGTTRYALCLYDREADLPLLKLSTSLPVGAAWWKAKGSGLGYRPGGSAPGGITSVSIKAGSAGKSAVTVNGKGAALDLSFLPLADDPGVTMQLVSSEGLCWSQDYSAPARRSDADRFQDRAD